MGCDNLKWKEEGKEAGWEENRIRRELYSHDAHLDPVIPSPVLSASENLEGAPGSCVGQLTAMAQFRSTNTRLKAYTGAVFGVAELHLALVRTDASLKPNSRLLC